MTTILSEITQEVFAFEESDDPELRTHIVSPADNLHIWKEGMSGRDVVDLARLTGTEIKALCGYIFVPKHNPDLFEACDACLEMASGL